MIKAKYLIISHGRFADGLKEAVEMITGPHDNLKSFCLLGGMAPETFGQMVEKEIQNNEEQKCVTMVFVDLLGGTPFNALIPVMRKYQNVSFVTGVNLAACIEVICNDEFESLQDMEEKAKEIGLRSIVTKKDLFGET